MYVPTTSSGCWLKCVLFKPQTRGASLIVFNITQMLRINSITFLYLASITLLLVTHKTNDKFLDCITANDVIYIIKVNKPEILILDCDGLQSRPSRKTWTFLQFWLPNIPRQNQLTSLPHPSNDLNHLHPWSNLLPSSTRSHPSELTYLVVSIGI